MSREQVFRYLEAKKEFDTAYSKIRQIQSTILDVARFLNQPLHFMVSGANVGFPPGVAPGESPRLDAKGWPSADQLAQYIVNLHKAYNQTQNAWTEIPKSEQVQLTPPPDIK